MARVGTRFLSTASSNKIAVSTYEQVGMQLAVTQIDVCVLVGSLRKALSVGCWRTRRSCWRQLLWSLAIVEIGHLPFYNQDIEDHPAVEWTTFRERVKATNAVLFVTPEYNRSVPAVLHRLGSARLTMDERSFAVLKQISASEPEDRRLTLRECKELVREQYLMLRLDEGRALAAIPKLLGADGTANPLAARDIVRRTVASYGTPEGAAAMRLARIEALFKAATAVVPRIGEPRRIGEASSIAAVTRREGRSRESGEPSAAWAEGDGRKHDPRR